MKQTDPESIEEAAPAKPDKRRKRSSASGIPQSGAEVIKARIVTATTKPKVAPKRNRATTKGRGPMPEGYEPPRKITAPARQVRPPSLHREALLPIVDIGSRKFEELCRDILRIKYPEVRRVSFKSRNGQKQYGVDVEGFVDFDPTVVVSAKCYRDVCAWDLTAWIQEFTKHLSGHWKGKDVRHFVLAVTHEMNDDDMNDGARLLAAELASKGIKFDVWNLFDITETLRSDPSLVGRYFHLHWVDAISAKHVEGSGTPSLTSMARSGSASLGGQIEALVDSFTATARSEIEKLRAAGLSDAVRAFRAGRPSVLKEWFAEVRGDQTSWVSLTPELRAKALRTSAMLRLQACDEIGARAMLDEADELAEAPDRVARALLLREGRGGEEALAFMAEPWSPSERELVGALLIDLGREGDAISALRSLSGSQVTAEVLRLRAVAHRRMGDHEAATREAASAVARAPDEVIPRFTAAVLHVLEALVDGVHAQFGERPNPIHPGLLRDGRDALRLLDGAAADLHQLASVTESPFREAAEAWEVAALLLHPDRRAAGATLVRTLVRRKEPDPVVVAWAMNYGLLRHRGRIKRAFHEALRSGRGTATMAIVLARLLAGSDHPERGLTLLKRYASLFDRDRSMLDAWSVQFGEPTGRVGHPFADALRRERQDPSSGALHEYLSSPGATVEEVLSGCEALAQRSCWSQVISARARLVGIGNLHALGLAAYAAFRTGAYGDCLDVLEISAQRCDAGQLPRSLVFLRSRANDALGRHGDSIHDLRAARLGGGGEEVDFRLLEAYQRIGALTEFQEEAERALASARLDPRQALQVAHVLRSAAPETARRALAEATRDGVPPEAAGAVMALAARLGLGQIQDDAVRFLISSEGSAFTIKKFEGVESLVAFMEENSREYRQRIDDWRLGRTPAAIAFHSEPKDFAYLFLAGEGGRRNRLGDLLPMLLRAGGLSSRHMPATGKHPPLRMDLSALLLAAGLGILPAVDKAFDIQVPRSAPEALVELEAELSSINLDLVRRCSVILGDGPGPVEIVDEPPSGSVSLEAADDPATLDLPVLGEILRRAFQDGHLDRPTAEGLIGGPLPAIVHGTAAGVFVVTRATLVQVVANGTLDIISRVARLCITFAEADRCRQDLADAMQAHEVRHVVSDLRSTAAAGLKGSWTTVTSASADIANEGEVTPKPPHLRCLMEVIAAQEHAPIACWIEDRMMSRSGFAGVVDVVDVVDHLHREGTIDTAERSAIRRRLRDKGYSYVAPDEAEILDTLLQAPVDDGGVVQTPGLTALRAWVVEEFARARHLDQAVIVDPRGAPQGEIRHVLALDGLARRTLVGIWSAPSKSQAEKVACSEWAWTYLGTVGAPGWPDEVEPERRRRYLAMTVAHTLDLVLLDSLGQRGMSADDRRGLVRWFDAAQIRPMIRADAGANPAVADILAPTLVAFLDHEPPGELDPELRDRYALLRETHVRGLFDLLPDDLAEEIGRRQGLEGRLDAKTTLALTFGDDKKVSLDHLADAYALCAASMEPDGSVPLTLADGSPATLRISDRDASSAIIVAGKVSTELPSSTCALLEADAGKRKAALASLAWMTDHRGLLRASHLQEIAAMEPLTTRVGAFEEAVGADYHQRIARLGRVLRGSQSIAITEFALPSPGSMLAYMRVSSSGVEDARAAVDSAVTRLVAELGLEEAVRRFAGWPVDPPVEIVSAFACSFPTTFAENGDEVVASPMLTLIRLRGLLITDAGAEAVSAAVLSLVAALNIAGPVFASLVRAGMAQVIADPLWSEVSPSIAACMVWAHADHVVHLLLGADVDCGRFAALLDQATKQDFRGFEQRRAMRPWVARVTTDLTARLLDALLASHVVSDAAPGRIPADAETALKALCGSEGPTGLSPSLDIVAPASVGPDELWIARDLVAQWLDVGWTSSENPFAERGCTALARRFVALEGDPAHPYMLAVLIGAIGPQEIEEGALPAIWEAMAAAKGDAVLEPEYAGMFRVLSAYAIVLGRMNDRQAFDKVLDRQAARCRAKWPNERIRHRDMDNDAHKAFGILMAGAFEHAMALPGSRAERAQAYGEAAAIIARAWPGALEGATSKLDALVRQLDAMDAAGLWRVLLKLRGTVPPTGSTPSDPVLAARRRPV